MNENHPQNREHRQKSEETVEEQQYNLSTILGIDVLSLGLPADVLAMADVYIKQLKKDNTNQAKCAELAWALRRQLQCDLSENTTDEDENGVDLTDTHLLQEQRKKYRETMLVEDKSMALSVAIYCKLLEMTKETIGQELARHASEIKYINGTYEEYKNISQTLSDYREQLTALFVEMFHRAGQEPKPIHLIQRAMLEARISEHEDLLKTSKEGNPDVAALVAHDTIQTYADELRSQSKFINTPSRRKIFDMAMRGATFGKPMMVLMGETGVGKTAIARAISLKLNGREPERTVGGQNEKLVRMLVAPKIDKQQSFYEYGSLLRAMTGKTSSQDESYGQGSVFFDDEFNTRPTSVQREIKKFVAEARHGRTITIPGTPLRETVQHGFLYLAAGNPAGERYEREETGIETRRETAGNEIEMDYLQQDQKHPELYQSMLAALRDGGTKRWSAVSPDEVEPEWTQEATSGEWSLKDDPDSGGFVWRFANCWKELLNAFSHKKTIMHERHNGDPKEKWYLDSFVFDVGKVIEWLDEYKVDPTAQKGHLEAFFAEKLRAYIMSMCESDAEQDVVNEYLRLFNIGWRAEKDKRGDKTFVWNPETQKPASKVMTPREIGYLNPNVPRPKDKGKPPTFKTFDSLTKEGVVIRYFKQPYHDIVPGELLVKKELSDPDHKDVHLELTFLGLLANDDGSADEAVAVVDVDGFGLTMNTQDLLEWYELKSETGQGIPESTRAYDSSFTPKQERQATTEGFAIAEIKEHPKAQYLVDALSRQDLQFADITDPQNIKPDTAKILAYWNTHCSDLPNIADKSMWFLEAIFNNTLDQITNADSTTAPILTYLPNFAGKGKLFVMNTPEFDWNNPTEKQTAMNHPSMQIIKELFNTTDPTNISRDQINTTLWEGNPYHRIQSKKAITFIDRILGKNAHKTFELRLLHFDEYTRLAKAQGWGDKDLWTHMEGYKRRDDGFRSGLDGGFRGYGGSADVDYGRRTNLDDYLALRLALSRK